MYRFCEGGEGMCVPPDRTENTRRGGEGGVDVVKLGV